MKNLRIGDAAVDLSLDVMRRTSASTFCGEKAGRDCRHEIIERAAFF